MNQLNLGCRKKKGEEKIKRYRDIYDNYKLRGSKVDGELKRMSNQQHTPKHIQECACTGDNGVSGSGTLRSDNHTCYTRGWKRE